MNATEHPAGAPALRCHCPRCRGERLEALELEPELDDAELPRSRRAAPARPTRAVTRAVPRAAPRPRPPQPGRPRPPSRPLPRGAAALPACHCPRHGTEYVRWVQSALNTARGLRLPVDGVMAPDTRSALRAFQQDQGLPADGIAGPETEEALRAARRGGAPAGADPAADPPAEAQEFETLELVTDLQAEGWEGEIDRSSRDYIRWVQQGLNRSAAAGLAVDGIQGPATSAAVRAFQSRQGLASDGIVGPLTEAALVRAGAVQPPGGSAPGTPAGPATGTPPATGSGSALGAAAARIALQEYQRWGSGSIKESASSIRPVLEDYWRSGVGWLPAGSAWWQDTAWSGAFISWVMRRAGAGPDFKYSSAHTDYVAAAKANRLANNSNPFKAYRISEAAPRVGDLVCLERENSGVTYDNVDQGFRSSHCDVVVEVRPGSITTIGGNLSDSVGRTSNVPTDSQGRITRAGYYAVVRVGAGATTPPTGSPTSGTPRVTVASNATVSAAAVRGLESILRNAGLASATITSGQRGSADQARVMFDNLERYGVAAQKTLYGSYGDQVIDVYAAEKAKGRSATAIQSAMQAKIVALGCTKVSRHCSDTQDVIDVAPSSIADASRFLAALAAAKAAGTVSVYLSPADADPAFHIEFAAPATGHELMEEILQSPALPAQAFVAASVARRLQGLRHAG